MLPILEKKGEFRVALYLISPMSYYIYVYIIKIKKKLELNLVLGNLKVKRTEILAVYTHILCQVNVMCRLGRIASFGET